MLRLRGDGATQQYVSNGLTWAVEDVGKHAHRVGFLDALSLQIKHLSASEADET